MRGRREALAAYVLLGGGLLFGTAAAQDRSVPTVAVRPAGWTGVAPSDPRDFEVSGRVRLPGGRPPAQRVTFYIQDLRQVPPVITAVHAAGAGGDYRFPLGPGWWRVIPTGPGLVFDPPYRDYALSAPRPAIGPDGRGP